MLDIYFDEKLKKLSDDIFNEEKRKKLFIIGEVLVVNKEYLNNNFIRRLNKNYDMVKQLLVEELYMFYKDFSNKRNKINK